MTAHKKVLHNIEKGRCYVCPSFLKVEVVARLCNQTLKPIIVADDICSQEL